MLGQDGNGPDLALIHHLRRGVPTGIHCDLPSSHQWPPSNDPHIDPDTLSLDLCHGNWKAAEEAGEEVQALIDKEVQAGWMVATDLALEEAKLKWPLGISLGKLNVVYAQGRGPCQVLNSAICGVNSKCHLPQRVALPMATDIRQATQPSDPHGSVDFKAAQQVMVRPKDQRPSPLRL